MRIVTMRNKSFILFIIGMLSLCCEIQGRSLPQRDGFLNVFNCLDFGCDNTSGPVCGIDASGFPRTFSSRCSAELAYCREGRYYVEIKGGEC